MNGQIMHIRTVSLRYIRTPLEVFFLLRVFLLFVIQGNHFTHFTTTSFAVSSSLFNLYLVFVSCHERMMTNTTAFRGQPMPFHLSLLISECRSLGRLSFFVPRRYKQRYEQT